MAQRIDFVAQARQPALQRHIRYFLLLLALLPAMASAQDYRSVAVARAVAFDAPAASAKKRFVLSQFYPVEVIVNLGAWVKVRDKTGELMWMESASLASQRTVLALDRADVLSAGDASSAVVFRVEKDVALEWQQPAANGWLKVRHRDGLTGFIATDKVWGL